MSFDLNTTRTAKDVIDDAIRENSTATWLLYGFAIVFALVGICVFISGIYLDNTIVIITGTMSSFMFWPAMNAARRTRKENIAIRLLEVPLSQSNTAEEAAVMLHRLVNEILNDNKGDGE